MASLLAKQEAARKEIAEVNGGVMPEEAAFGEPNPIYAQVKLRQIEIDTQIEELRRRAAAARTEAAALAAKAEDVPRVEAELQRLNRSEEHTSELQSLMRISYAVFCLKKKKRTTM